MYLNIKPGQNYTTAYFQCIIIYNTTQFMKDQLALLRKCIVNDIPATVFHGDDCCTVEVLEAAIEIYRKHGVSPEFLYDFQNVIDDVKAYQKLNPLNVKLADASVTEKELLRDEMIQKGLFV